MIFKLFCFDRDNSIIVDGNQTKLPFIILYSEVQKLNNLSDVI